MDNYIKEEKSENRQNTENAVTFCDDETIAAISTPVGKGGIGIVRISGKNAYRILQNIFLKFTAFFGENIGEKIDKENNKDKSAGINNKEEIKFLPRRLYYGKIRDENGKTLDKAIAVYMPAPHSYTGEDVAELQCHGGEKLLSLVLKLVLKSGARLASPGEFTMRAFLNGKMDLTQAEAVADIIDAKTDTSLELSVSQLSGSLSKKFNAVENKLLDLISSIQVGVDFPDDEDALSYAEAEIKIKEIIGDIDKMLLGAQSGRIYREGLRCVLIGEVNAGKSSLFNALLEQERAIVTDIPGTTRDTIEEYIDLQGVPIMLIDTAGLRETEEKIEQMGIERSRIHAENAQLLLFLLDSSRALSDEGKELLHLNAEKDPLYVLTKTDLPLNEETIKFLDENYFKGNYEKVCRICVKNGAGMRELKEKILQFSVGTDKPRSGLINNLRHEQALRETAEILKDALQTVQDGMSIDLIGIDLMNAYSKLGEITGKTAGEEVINNIFSKFCLGK